MTADDRTTSTAVTAPATGMSRRRLLATSSLTVSLGALLAACGGGTAAAPGRVGNAPTPTPLPDEPVDDAVLLRTATSLEHTALDMYAWASELGVLDGTAEAMVARMVEDHTATAAAMSEATAQAGGEPFDCANQWFAVRIMPPLYERIVGTGDDAASTDPIPASDDPARDVLGLAYAFETTLAAMYQEMVVKLQDPALRVTSITTGSQTARHAAVLAVLRDGAPVAYVNPVLAGASDDTTLAEGLTPIFAVPNHFGSLAPVQVTIGPATDAGTRFTASLQTPAANAYVYPSLACEA